jgi:hypothetical protein
VVVAVALSSVSELTLDALTVAVAVSETNTPLSGSGSRTVTPVAVCPPVLV